MSKPTVSVNIVTYNHAKYISQAIEGALKQKTNFPFEILIGEDDSSDGTREICIEYAKNHPEKIRLFLNDRKNVIYINGRPTGRWNMINLIKNSKGKYIALCEGDDYWTDPYKLQKQVDFLESHPDYGLVHSDFGRLSENENVYIKSAKKYYDRKVPVGNVFEELLIFNFIATCTVCVRRELILRYNIFDLCMEKNFKMGDYPLWLEISKHTKIGYINESLSTYRVMVNSMSHSSNPQKQFEFFQSEFDIKAYYMKKYGCSTKTKQLVSNRYNNKMFMHLFFLKDKKLAKEFLKNIRNQKQRLNLIQVLLYLGAQYTLFGEFVKFLFIIKTKNKKYLFFLWKLMKIS